MPGLTTPQFTWSKRRMSRKAQSVPPFYEPEVAADAIVWAAHHYRGNIRMSLNGQENLGHSLSFGPANSKLTGRPTFRADLCWPAISEPVTMLGNPDVATVVASCWKYRSRPHLA